MLKFPELYQLLAEGKVNCTTASLISKLLTESNKEELLGSIVGKSVREVEAIVAEQRPVEEKPRERIKVIAQDEALRVYDNLARVIANSRIQGTERKRRW